LPEGEFDSPTALERILLFGELRDRPAVYLRDVATIDLVPAPATIQRDNQNRIVEITASPTGDLALGEIMDQIHTALKDYRLPLGHHLYSSGTEKTLQEGRNLSLMLLGLALFLVFVVMSVQYESLRNPTVIMLGVPFAVIGVFTGLKLIGLPVSMPVWLGLIMLSGIVVNNAIVLVEYIEILREQGREIREAIIEAGRLRLRPILMTTLTTVVGMAPLALGLGEGAEMLQPLAVTVVTGLSFSLLVSLLLVPCIYILMRQSPLKVRRTGDSYG
jgi:multidrug efflux pump subunit AcrB